MAHRRRPAASKSPLPLILGIGGFGVVLIVVVAVAVSGGGKPPPRKAVEAAPEAVGKDRSVQDTGYIMFVCANSPKHPDKEVVLASVCPACAKASTYLWDAGIGSYRCFGCGKEYPRAKIACPDCGKVPGKTRLKHR
jgi:hypothetical protein